MMGKTIKTPELLASARRLRGMHYSYRAIGRNLGVTDTTVMLWLNPERVWKQRTTVQACMAEKRALEKPISRDEYLACLASIPPDTRDITSSLCGDPLPGRSALDRKTKEAAHG